MTSTHFFYALYLLPLAFILFVYMRRQTKVAARDAARLKAAMEAGLTEPASLHPVFNAALCVGSLACVNACPEGAIGVIKGKGHLIDASKCIGHGACHAACPTEAITLVFGTEKRGVDIPLVSPTFETNVRGIFIAGELGGMGLIRKAVEQGRQAMESIRKREPGKVDYDVVIVGAGPAGLSASLGAIQHKLRFVTVEQEDSLGGTVYHYPRNKIVMTTAVQLPIIGEIKMGEISKESLLEFWHGVVKKTGLKVNFNERMEAIVRHANHFEVKTSKTIYKTRSVLLSIGRRGTPRKLSVPGEEQPKVVYRLMDAEQYRGQHVLIVGGGDSALEAALAIADEPGTTVTLSYRSEAFGRVKAGNRERIEQAQATGRVRVLLKSNVKNIGTDKVSIDHDGKRLNIRNDAVIVCAGGVLPTPFLKEIGIQVDTKFGTA